MPRQSIENIRITSAGKTDEEIVRQLGEALKLARIAVGLTQIQLAARAKVSRGTIVNAESGRHVMSSIAWIRCFNAMGIDWRMHFNEQGAPRKTPTED